MTRRLNTPLRGLHALRRRASSRAASPWQTRLAAACLLCLLGLSPKIGHSQSVSDDLRFDAQEARANASAALSWGTAVSSAAFIEPPRGDRDSPSDSATKDYTFYFLLPTLYNSNAESAYAGGSGSFEYNPEVRLGYSKQLPNSIKISALLDANSDRYTGAADANGDTFYGTLRIQHVTGGDAQEFQPFLEYSPRLTFDPTWGKRQATTQDVTVGFDKAWNFLDNFTERVAAPIADCSQACTWSLGFTGLAKRRFSDAGPDAWLVGATPSITWNRIPPNHDASIAQWNASFQLGVTYRSSDPLAGVTRHDVVISPVLTAEVLPPFRWFGSGPKKDQATRRDNLGLPRIDFQLAFSNDHASIPGKGFHQWNVGPSLKTSWKF